jgi:hypothetical protein
VHEPNFSEKSFRLFVQRVKSGENHVRSRNVYHEEQIKRDSNLDNEELFWVQREDQWSSRSGQTEVVLDLSSRVIVFLLIDHSEDFHSLSSISLGLSLESTSLNREQQLEPE